MMTNNDDYEPVGKKVKSNLELKSFKIEETLNFKSREKVMVVKGKFDGSVDDSVLIFEKTAFPENSDDIQKSISFDKFESKNIMRNDIYGTENINGMDSINSIKLTVISPATEKHLQRYKKPKFHFVSETPRLYNDVTLPFIQKNNFSNAWIENLINKKAELDRVLLNAEDTENGFILAMDYKWDGKNLEDIHYIAIVSCFDLHSLRDLNEKHLPLLLEIMDKCKSSIETKYGIPKSQLRLYFHYPPSFYHLHVHVSHVNSDNASALVDRAYLLSSVIHNIKLKSNYYQQAILDVTVNVNDPLYELYKENKCFE